MTNSETKTKGFRGIFGQFATREFWGSLLSFLVREAISNVILGLGGSLVSYARVRLGNDGVASRNVLTQGNQPVQPVQHPSSPSSAFANGYAPRATYNVAPQPAAPIHVVPTPPAQTAQQADVFPGFGR